MMTGKQGFQSSFGPSDRISELALHKTSKTVSTTAPCERLVWGNQEPIWSPSASALGAVPSARIQYLAKHKRDFSAWEDHRRKEEEEAAKTQRTSSMASQYKHIVRLSTPLPRRCGSREMRPPHTPQCEKNCPIWHVDLSMRTVVITPRLLQLSNPKQDHPDFQRDRESVESIISFASKTARISQRVVQLSRPRLKQGIICNELGTVSKAAREATASARVEMLATPKPLSKDYIPLRVPGWS
ncbi:uncharacterized protein LOC119494785 isoform X1 [Sebastes umbrosus]|uniref:uncharacterized protein LOC119494785 isoform X1 n=1 Tax=Sebastes umbrosus TaxID=72105 RepID=UPI0018A0989B|nr:uncharacterized protein LOC119494785 isoform X1 [Sebastes umbrosus]